MSAAMENLRSDVHKPPEQLEREADSARHAVEGTLAELEQRLSPGELLDRVMDVVKRHGGEFGDNLLTQVRNNPLPTIIAGVGVAWLMTASKRPPPRGYPHFGDDYGSDDRSGTADRFSSAFESARDTASSTAESAKSAATDAMDATTRAARGAADAAERAAHRAADMTRQTADRVARASRASAHSVTGGYSYLYREQPLVLGAIAVAAGAALGALLPSTRSEDSVLGETSDEVKARLQSEAESRGGELREAAAEAVETVKKNLTGDDSQEPDRSFAPGSMESPTS
jgi:uncharacterized protein DUF3618